MDISKSHRMMGGFGELMRSELDDKTGLGFPQNLLDPLPFSQFIN